LATEAGIAYNTCKTWLSYLSTGYIIQLLQPYHKNFNKKITKAQKIYFTDTGLLCHLLGVHSKEHIALHPLRGAIYENLVFNELLKNNVNSGNRWNIWYWRDNHGTEIDFLLERATEITAIEAKSAKNFHDDYFKNLLKFKKYNPDVKEMYLVYDGQLERKKNNIHIVNWKNTKYLA